MLASGGCLHFRPVVGDVGVGTCRTPISEAGLPGEAAASPRCGRRRLCHRPSPPLPPIGSIARVHATTATGMGFGVVSSSPIDRGCAQWVVVGEAAETSTAIYGQGEEVAKVDPEGRRSGAGDVGDLQSGSPRPPVLGREEGAFAELSRGFACLRARRARCWTRMGGGFSGSSGNGGGLGLAVRVGLPRGTADFRFVLSGPRWLGLPVCSRILPVCSLMLRWTAPSCCLTSVTQGRCRAPAASENRRSQGCADRCRPSIRDLEVREPGPQVRRVRRPHPHLLHGRT